jgi:lipopolysaccharide heptosyltransferase II
MKIIDKSIGALVVRVPPAVVAEQIKTMTSLLFIRPGGIGDAVLLSPVINSLKKIFPTIHITVLAEHRNAGVFTLIPGVDTLYCYDSGRELITALRGHYDSVIDTEQSHRLSAVVARFTSAPVKIGFATNERRRMFTNPVSYSQDDYEAVSFAHLLEPLGIVTGAVDLGAPFIFIPDAASSTADRLLEALHDEPFVALFPGASIPERRWGADRFCRVAELLSVFGIQIVVVGGKEDLQQGELISGGGLGLNLAGMTSLSETAAIIQRSSLLLSGDSGILHIGVGLGIPTVSLFGPGRAKKWAPRGDRHIVINKELPCSPCTTFGTTPSCPINVRCMRDITVEEVANSVVTLLSRVGDVPS